MGWFKGKSGATDDARVLRCRLGEHERGPIDWDGARYVSACVHCGIRLVKVNGGWRGERG